MDVLENFRLLHDDIVEILALQFLEYERVVHIVKILAITICVPKAEIVIPKRTIESSRKFRVNRMNL